LIGYNQIFTVFVPFKIDLAVKELDEMLFLNNDSFTLDNNNNYNKIFRFYKEIITYDNECCIYFDPTKLVIDDILVKISKFKYFNFKNIKHLELYERLYSSNNKLENYYFLSNKIFYYKNDFDSLKYLPNSIKILDCNERHTDIIKNIPNKIKVIVLKDSHFSVHNKKSLKKYKRINKYKVDIFNMLDGIYELVPKKRKIE
jgi:hypothetical protein